MELNINIEQYLSKIKIRPPVTLFSPNPKEMVFYLSQKKCPLCYHKLYPLRNGKLWLCKSKRADGFKIKSETLKKYE